DTDHPANILRFPFHSNDLYEALYPDIRKRYHSYNPTETRTVTEPSFLVRYGIDNALRHNARIMELPDLLAGRISPDHLLNSPQRPTYIVESTPYSLTSCTPSQSMTLHHYLVANFLTESPNHHPNVL